MIEKLTPEQELQLPEYFRKYQNIGLSTEEVDPSVEKDLNIFYKYMGKENPIYIYVDNLWEANVVASSLKTDIPFPELDYHIDEGKLIPRNVIEDISKKVKVEMQGYNIGNLNAYWLSFFCYCEDVIDGVEYDYKEYDKDILKVWNRIINKVGYFMPFEQYCILMNRPKELHFDENRELHCEDGPAVSYRRGTECDVYAINGVVVPRKVVMEPESITLEQVLKEENAEIKRIMMDVYGMGRYLEGIGAKVLDVDTAFSNVKGGSGTMLRSLMQDDGGRKYLVSTDGSTSRCYWMQVPNEVKTCVDADKALAGGRDPSRCVAVS